MGGTSTDVSWSDGSDAGPLGQRRELSELNGLPLQAAMLDIHTVAAGGGSLIRFDGLRLQVGPASAGADPGPACYGRGGPLTVTDANLLLGRLQASQMPVVFGPSGDQPLDATPLRPGFAALAASLGCQGDDAAEQVAEGALAIAVERMAEAIRRISIQQGRDVRRAVLCSFGGAGGQHACAVAEALGIEQVLLHPLAGVLSAYGIGLADEVQLIERSVRQPLTASVLQALLPELAAGVPDGSREAPAALRLTARRRCTLQLRTAGSDTCLPVPWDEGSDPSPLLEAFSAEHRRRFGYAPELGASAATVVLERLSVEWIQPGEGLGAVVPGGGDSSADASDSASPVEMARVYLQGAWCSIPLWSRESLRCGMHVEGPALIVEATGTNLLLPHWDAQVLAEGSLLFRHQSREDVPVGDVPRLEDQPLDALTLELFSNRFTAIAEQMGTRLQQTSSSVNIKERLDFSCALFDAAGRLVVNAPHMPVHLGSMDRSVEAIIRQNKGRIKAGDVFALNAPYNGGTHLPDITVCTPVFDAAETKILFWVARAGIMQTWVA